MSGCAGVCLLLCLYHTILGSVPVICAWLLCTVVGYVFCGRRASLAAVGSAAARGAIAIKVHVGVVSDSLCVGWTAEHLIKLILAVGLAFVLLL